MSRQEPRLIAGPRAIDMVGTRPARGEGHERHITALAWQPTGDRVATGGADGRIVIWASPSRAGRTLQPFAVHERGAAVAAVAWTRTGDALVVGSRPW